jgi:uncharacterized membrane protein (UPF0182 family)
MTFTWSDEIMKNKERAGMSRWKRWLALLLSTVVGILLLYVVVSFVFLDFMVDFWWFRALNYEGYFWLRQGYRYLVFAGVTLSFFFIFFLNFWVASRYLGTSIPAETKTGGPKRDRYRKLMEMFQRGSLKVYVPFSLALSILVAVPIFSKWETFLLYMFGPDAGVTDPVFGRDVSYYLFSFPIYVLLQHRLLVAVLFLIFGLAILYWYENRLLGRTDQRLPRGAKSHLSSLIFLVLIIQIWGYLLQRYDLLYSQNHEPLFFGPGFVEMRVVLPLIWLSILLFGATALSVVFFIHRRKGLKLCIFLGLGFLVSLGLRHAKFLPQIVQEYSVKPNEIVREKPFIRNSIEATLAAYDLSKVKTREYAIEKIPWTASDPDVAWNVRNIPVWDREMLEDVYKQLQGIRPYYDFPSVDVDRYIVGGRYQQVYLAARELNVLNLPTYAQNWVNLHLQYTHGKGAVMTPAVQGGDEAMTWFIQDIPPQSQYGFTIQQPDIYYGLTSNSPYVLAPNEVKEMDYPEGETNVLTDYRGQGGVPLSSLFRKLLCAVYFKDRNLFFTTKTNEKTKVLFRRSIVERIRRLTPYLLLDSDPYVVVTSQGVFWIQDAYTTSERYPNAQPGSNHFNYMRNSVKIVVDAYNGSVTYYIADPKDPMIQAYRRMYPGLLKSLEQMSAELKPHLRYPKDFFVEQMGIYGKYHQTDPELFYRQEDIWDFAAVMKEGKSMTMTPYYLTLNLVERNRHEFLLLSPMSPGGRDNLRSLAVARCDGESYGEMILYSFPKGEQVYGPSQISALIDQDTTIAQQFTLWDQIGSKVKRGRMIVLPMGPIVFYIQPVYLEAAAGLKIPELKRLIVSQGDAVVMASSLKDAFRLLEAQVKEKIEHEKWNPSLEAPGFQPQGPSEKEVEPNQP